MFFTGLTEWTPRNLILRIVVSLILGSLIGIDRGAKKRGGGARTDAAVCLGATLVMMTAQYIELVFPGKADMARLPAQVISGVGFLGAGSIIISGHQIKGLTSAASIWICACIGLAVGIGFVDGAVLATVILLGMLHVLPWVEGKVYKHSRYMLLHVEAAEGRAAGELMRKLKADGCVVDMFEVDRLGTDMQSFTITITIRVPRRLSREEYAESLLGIGGITSIDSM